MESNGNGEFSVVINDFSNFNHPQTSMSRDTGQRQQPVSTCETDDESTRSAAAEWRNGRIHAIRSVNLFARDSSHKYTPQGVMSVDLPEPAKGRRHRSWCLGSRKARHGDFFLTFLPDGQCLWDFFGSLTT